MAEESQYIEKWSGLETRAGRTISTEERQQMREAGIIFYRIKGRPPERKRVIFTYWDLYLKFMMKKNNNR